MSSNRTIIESLLYSDTNATNSNPHANQTNPVRARLANRLEARRTSPTNTSLPHTMTLASPNGTVFQLASIRGEHLDATLDRKLIDKLGFTLIDNSLCNKAGESLYLNEDCHPYFRYRVGTRQNDDTRSTFYTTLALFACDEDSLITLEQQTALDDFCRYNDNPDPITKYWPYAVGIPIVLALLLICGQRQYFRYKESRERPVGVDTDGNPNLTQSLLPQEEKRHETESIDPDRPTAFYRI